MLEGRCLALSNRRCEAFFEGMLRRLYKGPNHIISEWANDGEYIMPRFYKRLASKARTTELTDAEIEEVLTRCRLMRCLPRDRATDAAHAMAVTLGEILSEHKPDYFFSRMVDRYSNDILDRLCEKRGIRIVEFVQGAKPGLTRLTRRGEYQYVRDPEETEIRELMASLSDPSKVLVFAISKKNFTPRYYYGKVATRFAKHVYFTGLRAIKRDPLNYQWLMNSLPIDATGDLFGYRVVESFDENWRQKLEARKSPAVAIPLVHIPEATTDYWIANVDFVNYCDMIVSICKANADLTFVVKEHWSGMGLKPRQFFADLANLPNVIVVPPDAATFRQLLQLVDGVFAGEGTAGLEAMIAGKPVIFYDEPSYYLPNPLAAVVTETSELMKLSGVFANLSSGASEQLSYDLCKRVLESTLHGSVRYMVDAHESANLDLLAGEFERYLTRPEFARS